MECVDVHKFKIIWHTYWREVDMEHTWCWYGILMMWWQGDDMSLKWHIWWHGNGWCVVNVAHWWCGKWWCGANMVAGWCGNGWHSVNMVEFKVLPACNVMSSTWKCDVIWDGNVSALEIKCTREIYLTHFHANLNNIMWKKFIHRWFTSITWSFHLNTSWTFKAMLSSHFNWLVRFYWISFGILFCLCMLQAHMARF